MKLKSKWACSQKRCGNCLLSLVLRSNDWGFQVGHLQMQVVEKDVSINVVKHQAQDVASHKTEVGSARRAIGRLRRQLGKLVVSSNSQITRLQNQVQGYSRLLKDVRGNRQRQMLRFLLTFLLLLAAGSPGV